MQLSGIQFDHIEWKKSGICWDHPMKEKCESVQRNVASLKNKENIEHVIQNNHTFYKK